MAVTPDDLLRAATEMGQRDSEVHWGSAASRAYYAAYHRCRQMAMAERLEIQEGGSQHVALATAVCAHDTRAAVGRLDMPAKASPMN